MPPSTAEIVSLSVPFDGVPFVFARMPDGQLERHTIVTPAEQQWVIQAGWGLALSAALDEWERNEDSGANERRRIAIAEAQIDGALADFKDIDPLSAWWTDYVAGDGSKTEPSEWQKLLRGLSDDLSDAATSAWSAIKLGFYATTGIGLAGALGWAIRQWTK